MPVNASQLPTKTFAPRFTDNTSKIEVQNPRTGFAPATEAKPTGSAERATNTSHIKTGQKIDILV